MCHLLRRLCRRDKDFHKISPVHTKRYVASMCRRNMLLPLVAGAITGTAIYNKLCVISLRRCLGNVENSYTDHSATSWNFRDKPFQCLLINVKTTTIAYHAILQKVLFGCINNIGYGGTHYLHYISCST